MKKINLKMNLKNLTGGDVTPVTTLGEVLASHMAGSIKGDPIKYLDWAIDLYNSREISVDEADFIKIKNFIQDSDTITILAKGQMLKHLNTIK